MSLFKKNKKKKIRYTLHDQDIKFVDDLRGSKKMYRKDTN